MLTAAASVLLPFALVFYPFVVFGPIAAAAGDAPARGPSPAACASRGRPRPVAMVVFGLVIVGAFLWFGFVIGFSPRRPATRRPLLAIGAATLIAWPVAALVERNLYGDLTGRLVIRDAPGDAERMADLARRGKTRD